MNALDHIRDVLDGMDDDDLIVVTTQLSTIIMNKSGSYVMKTCNVIVSTEDLMESVGAGKLN